MASPDVQTMPASLPKYSPIQNMASTKRKRAATTETSIPLIDKAANGTPSIEKVSFDAQEHVNFTPPSKIWTMNEIGFAGKGVSNTAVSEPFPLFTTEAVKQMRNEVLSKEVLENCQYSSNLAKCQLRGYASDYAPFVYDAWRSPEILAIISKIAGVELVPQMDFEIAHINISMQSEEQKREALAAVAEKTSRDADEGVAGCPWEDDQPIVDWHTDSYPFVCVTMLSDCTNMIGGETCLRTGNGDIMKVRGPQMGSAIVLQGRYIEHQALRALGTTERISMVTSFRPKSPKIKDDTVLSTVRAISDLSELYFQYSEYRLEMLEERVRNHLKELRERKRARRGFNTAATKKFLAEEQHFLASMNREIVDDDKVTVGITEAHTHLQSTDLINQSRKKMRGMSVAKETS